MALGQKPLQTYTCFWDVVQRGDYCGPTLDIERPEHFPNDKVFIEFVEGKVVCICDLYLDKEEEAKITSLGSRRHINRMFNLMVLECEDRPILAEQKDEVAERAKSKKPIPVKEKRPANAKGQRRDVRKHKASEPGDVRLRHEMARPLKKSRKFTLGDSDRSSGVAGTEGVTWVWGVVFSSELMAFAV